MRPAGPPDPARRASLGDGSLGNTRFPVVTHDAPRRYPRECRAVTDCSRSRRRRPSTHEAHSARVAGAPPPMSPDMRIAQVAPLFEAVPPAGYGGTERVVSYLTEQLVRMGVEVTLFA